MAVSETLTVGVDVLSNSAGNRTVLGCRLRCSTVGSDGVGWCVRCARI